MCHGAFRSTQGGLLAPILSQILSLFKIIAGSFPLAQVVECLWSLVMGQEVYQ